MAPHHHLDDAEHHALLQAEHLDDHQLSHQLRHHAALAQHGYSNADGLRSLATLALVCARRIDERASHEHHDRPDPLDARWAGKGY
jgi:hypothetical protein